ncbi:hypothetical protein KC19_VG079100 [Ceratodon purpureus]|uniref:Uncharacterized protein n=1 Tax=Ceratodon purpureus TaxID=3225 RepID=A0A8T0HN61_CERPU|nr:hypothetical protein KC19_VG079100 [Ceratodon purpureus]
MWIFPGTRAWGTSCRGARLVKWDKGPMPIKQAVHQRLRLNWSWIRPGDWSSGFPILRQYLRWLVPAPFPFH